MITAIGAKIYDLIARTGRGKKNISPAPSTCQNRPPVLFGRKELFNGFKRRWK